MKGFTRKLFLTLLFVVSSVCHAEEKNEPVRIAIYGDSLCSGYAVKWNETLMLALKSRVGKYSENADIMNACRYGDRAVDGAKRLNFYMEMQRPHIVVVALGFDDMTRGTKPKEIYENIEYIIKNLQQRGLKIVLVGIRALPQYASGEYALKFNEIYPTLANEYQLTFMPNMLDGVVGRQALTVGDQIHPNAKGNEVIADNMLPYIYAVLDEKKH